MAARRRKPTRKKSQALAKVSDAELARAIRVFQRSGLMPKQMQNLQAIHSRGSGWWPIVSESYPGAWQQDIEVNLDTVLTYSTIFACVSLIATDIGKMSVKLVEEHGDIWLKTESPAFSPVLRKPNHFQNRIKFYEYWVISKLVFGNTYVLKQRDQRQVVVALYVLDPQSVKPLVATNGDVFYELKRDYLSGQQLEAVIVPASEIIHDQHITLYHPLVGVSPIHACGVAATQALTIQNNQTRLFNNGSRPGGVLTAPGHINDDTATRIKDYWQTEFSGENVGKVAVLGDGLKYEPMAINAEDAQLIEQLKWTAEQVCACFHMPPYKVGVGPMPTFNNIEALNKEYHGHTLQELIECIELSLDEGLGLAPDKVEGRTLGTEFDIDDLARMDTATLVDAESKIVGAGIKAPNEARKRLNLPNVKGGDSPMMQNQNWSLEDLERRRELGLNPPGLPGGDSAAATAAPVSDGPEDDDTEKVVSAIYRKGMALVQQTAA